MTVLKRTQLNPRSPTFIVRCRRIKFFKWIYLFYAQKLGYDNVPASLNLIFVIHCIIILNLTRYTIDYKTLMEQNIIFESESFSMIRVVYCTLHASAPQESFFHQGHKHTIQNFIGAYPTAVLHHQEHMPLRSLRLCQCQFNKTFKKYKYILIVTILLYNLYIIEEVGPGGGRGGGERRPAACSIMSPLDFLDVFLPPSSFSFL